VVEQIVQVNTYPFGQCGEEPLLVLNATGAEVRMNPHERRLKPDEVRGLIVDADAVIAGTEPYTREVLSECPDLKAICRVGVGFDNVDLEACRDLDIVATYTPEAPADGVAELTVGLILSLIRGITWSNDSILAGNWDRHIGTLLSEHTVGILGVGRIGSRVLRLLRPFGARMLGCDIDPKDESVEYVNKGELFRRCDVVTVHVPLNPTTRYLVGFDEIHSMPRCSFLVNTSRGPIVDEYGVLSHLGDRLAGYGADVFENEPYTGPLIKYPNVVLTAHIGASARQSRFLMELGAAKDCANVLAGRPPENPIEVGP